MLSNFFVCPVVVGCLFWDNEGGLDQVLYIIKALK
jgi:hypothetical protein